MRRIDLYPRLKLLRHAHHRSGDNFGFYGAVFAQQAPGEGINALANFGSPLLPPAVLVALPQ